MTETPETITRDELAGYFSRLSFTDPEDAAANAFAEIAAHRKPEYEPGEIYQDTDGKRWRRLQPGEIANLEWLSCETCVAATDIVPKRPLRKLVPEGSDETVIKSDTVAAVIAKGILGNESSDVIIHRIGQLLDGES